MSLTVTKVNFINILFKFHYHDGNSLKYIHLA